MRAPPQPHPLFGSSSTSQQKETEIAFEQAFCRATTGQCSPGGAGITLRRTQSRASDATLASFVLWENVVDAASLDEGSAADTEEPPFTITNPPAVTPAESCGGETPSCLRASFNTP